MTNIELTNSGYPLRQSIHGAVVARIGDLEVVGTAGEMDFEKSAAVRPLAATLPEFGLKNTSDLISMKFLGQLLVFVALLRMLAMGGGNGKSGKRRR